MSSTFIILAAVVAGWMVQLYLTYRQSMRFNADVHALRARGTVSIGVGGNRYRGGRSYVAIVVADRRVVEALTLTGFTTFATAKPLPALAGVKVNRLVGDQDVPGLSRSQRAAARQAAELLKPERSTAVAGSPAPATP
jgi:DNA-binding transcriptional regulator of glucitol operon